MPSLPAHAAVGFALGFAAATPAFVARAGRSPRQGSPAALPLAWWLAPAIVSMAPDLDVLSFRFGIPYDAPLGHRGLAHSLVAALLLGVVVCEFVVRRWRVPLARARTQACLALAAASHGLLDAMTDGGRGIALLAPFASRRYFFDFRPIAVSPIGSHGFSIERVLSVARTELLWVGIPCAMLILTALTARHLDRARRVSRSRRAGP